MNGIFSIRHISLSSLTFSMKNSLKGKSKSSRIWLERQFKDEYVYKARLENYRARSAFKLLEIDDKHHILKPGSVVVECGSSPGAWTQVSVKKINATGHMVNKPVGTHIAIDLLPMSSVEGAIIFNADFTEPSTQENVTKSLDGRFIDCFLSDMAPAASGITTLDKECIFILALSVMEYAKLHSADGAALLCKLWEGGKTNILINELNKWYSKTKIVKPHSSRKESSELFILATGFQRKNC